MMDAAAYFITVSAQSKPICDRCPHPIVQVGFHVFGWRCWFQVWTNLSRYWNLVQIFAKSYRYSATPFGLILYKRADPQAQIVAGTMATGLAGSKRLGVLALAR